MSCIIFDTYGLGYSLGVFSQTLLVTLLSNQTMQRGLGDMAQ
jgi:hypothetical protein